MRVLRTAKHHSLFFLSLPAIFVLDLKTAPWGVAGWVLYLVPLLLTAWFPQRWLPLTMTLAGTLLIVLGFAPSLSSDGFPEMAVFSRLAGIGVLWATFVALSQGRRTQDALRTSYEELELAVQERTAAQAQALRASEERFQEIWRNSPTIMFIKDREGRYLNVNPQFLKLTSWSREQILGKTDVDIFTSDQAASFQANDRKVFEENRPLEFEEIAEHPDGPHTSIVYKFPLRRPTDGEPYALCGIVTDITERKRADTIRRLLIHKIMDAQEEERRRLAQELHDEAGQSLTALLWGLRRIEEMPTLDAVRAHTQDLHKITAHTIQEVDRLAMGLRPRALDEVGLEAALKFHAEEFMRTHDIAVDIQSSGLDGQRLPDPVETTLYRIAQEALTNVAKHAGARTVSILLRATSSDVLMIVEDDGCGFDVDAAVHGEEAVRHLGIHGIQRRAAMLGGSASIESTPGRGTTISVQMSLAGHAQAG